MEKVYLDILNKAKAVQHAALLAYPSIWHWKHDQEAVKDHLHELIDEIIETNKKKAMSFKIKQHKTEYLF